MMTNLSNKLEEVQNFRCTFTSLSFKSNWGSKVLRSWHPCWWNRTHWSHTCGLERSPLFAEVWLEQRGQTSSGRAFVTFVLEDFRLHHKTSVWLKRLVPKLDIMNMSPNFFLSHRKSNNCAFGSILHVEAHKEFSVEDRRWKTGQIVIHFQQKEGRMADVSGKNKQMPTLHHDCSAACG